VSEGRVFGRAEWLTEDLGRTERVRATEWKGLGWMEVFFVRMEGSALVGKKGPGAGKEIVADRRGRSGRGSGWTPRPFKSGSRTPSEILSSTQTARLRTVFCPPTDAPFSLLHFPVALPTGEAGRSLGSARGARGWSDRVTNSHPSVRARGKPSDMLCWISRFQFSWSSSGFQVLGFSRLFVWSQVFVVCRVANTSLPPAGGKH
jgi:hypothetical protein